MNQDRPQWIRWHSLSPELAHAIADEQQTVYLALHVYDNKLAILTVPTADRVRLGPRASARTKTRAVIMTIISNPPACPRGQTTHKNGASSQR